MEREQPLKNYEKKQQKEWLNNTSPDPSTVVNKKEEHH